MAAVTDNMEVVTPDDFIRQNFNSIPSPPHFINPFETMSTLWNKNLHPRESEMYPPLVEAINKCCPTAPSSQPRVLGDYRPSSKLECLNTSQMRKGNDAGLKAGLRGKMVPDLFITFDGHKVNIPRATAGNSALFLPNTSKDSSSANQKTTLKGKPSTTACTSADKGKNVRTNTDFINLFDCVGISVEVKTENNHDLGLLSSTKDSQKFLSSDRRKELLAQLFGYVEIAQWTALPYRFLWSITITGTILRISRWSSTGVVVTDPINYQADCTVVWQFLHAVGSGPYSSLGLDVGKGMTFSPILEYQEDRLKELATCYSDAAFRLASKKDWVLQAAKGTMWRLEIGSAAYEDDYLLREDRAKPSTRVTPANDKSKPEGSDKDSVYDEFKPEGSDKESANDESKPEGSEKESVNTYLVLSSPIHQSIGLMSRGTRCYLAIPEKIFFSADKICTQHLRMLKLSWQYISRHPEIHFFKEATERHEGHIPHLARVIAGGSCERTLQLRGRFVQGVERNGIDLREISPLPDRDSAISSDSTELTIDGLRRRILQSPSDDPNHRLRELQWTLFRDVGGNLANHTNMRELLNVFIGALKAHQDLVKVDILHRDISANNVMIGLSDREGLLIDLDMAEDLRERPVEMELDTDSVAVCPTIQDQQTSDGEAGVQMIPHHEQFSRPPITGTLRYLSLAMKARPVHRDWHDYESFLWILCFITLRHAHGVSWYEGPSIYHCNGVEDRLKVLQILFPDVDRTGNSAIDHLAAAKQRLFVRTSKLSVGSNPPVATLIRKLLDIFRPLHEALTTAHHLCAELEVLHQRLEIPFQPRPLWNPYSLPDLQQLQRYPKYISTEAKTALALLSAKVHEPGLDNDRRVECKQLVNGLDESHGICKSMFDEVKTFPTSQHIIDLFEVAAKDPKLNSTTASYDYIPPAAIESGRESLASSSKVSTKRSSPTALQNMSTSSRHQSGLPPSAPRMRTDDAGSHGQGSTSSIGKKRKREVDDIDTGNIIDEGVKRQRKATEVQANSRDDDSDSQHED